MIDKRFIGTIAENIFLCLLNQRDVFATAFDTEGLDGICFDQQIEYFKVGQSPFYVQIKCWGSHTDQYNPQGHSTETIAKIQSFAMSLGISENSLYLVVGFYKNDDVRSISHYIVPFLALDEFKLVGNNEYRFSVERCEEVRARNTNLVRI